MCLNTGINQYQTSIKRGQSGVLILDDPLGETGFPGFVDAEEGAAALVGVLVVMVVLKLVIIS